MKQKIRELAIQAGAGEWGDAVVPAMMDIEKFADLIVGECCKVLDEKLCPPSHPYNSVGYELSAYWEVME